MILRIFVVKNILIVYGINTFIVTLPSLGSIGGLLALLIFIYAVLGVQLFALVKITEPLNDIMNF